HLLQRQGERCEEDPGDDVGEHRRQWGSLPREGSNNECQPIRRHRRALYAHRRRWGKSQGARRAALLVGRAHLPTLTSPPQGTSMLCGRLALPIRTLRTPHATTTEAGV